MSKCRYCGKEYDGGGLWDDGFCCGRCRSLARSRNVAGKTPRGCLYIILFVIAFMSIIFFFSPVILKHMEKYEETKRQNTEIKSSKVKKKGKSQIGKSRDGTKSNQSLRPLQLKSLNRE